MNYFIAVFEGLLFLKHLREELFSRVPLLLLTFFCFFVLNNFFMPKIYNIMSGNATQ